MVETIKTLFELNVSLGVVTSNSGNNVQTWLTHYGINEYFEIILGGGGLLRKERCIRKVMGRHTIKPHELLYVGDESRDIKACHRLNVHCVAVTWGLDLEEKLRLDNPESLINLPAELLPMVRENLHPGLRAA
jgi:phosphoglycolate phosphatase